MDTSAIATDTNNQPDGGTTADTATDDTGADSVATPDVGDANDAQGDILAPDAALVDISQPDTTQPDTTQPDILAPDTTAPDATDPDAVQPDVLQPDTAPSDILAPDGNAPDVAAPDGAAPDLLAGDSAQADTGKPCTKLGCVCTAKSDCDTGHCAKAAGAKATDPGKCAPTCLQASDPDAACADSDLCTADVCDADKGCTHTKSTKACDDGNACTVDGCNSKSGCTHAASAGPCDDGNACTDGDACAGGLCKAGGAKSCDDGTSCTKDSCDATKGCQHASLMGPCDDGDACTKGDACKDGKCVAAAQDTCEDNNPCTDDTCDKQAGCVHKANIAACDDGNKCTDGDSCDGGQCKPGVAANCDDANPCTKDHCEMATGCTVPALDILCDDGDPCTSNDKCKAGACAPGIVKNCDDNNPCSTDACVAGKCDHTANTAPCEDGDPCTTADTCSTGSCDPGTGKKPCDDANPCTDDLCKSGKGCVGVPNAATCTDGDECTTGDHCAKGACTPTGGVKCDDGNPCTDDVCKKGLDGKPGGCVNTIRTGTCEDGNKCTGTQKSPDTCTAGKCKAGAAVPCDDGNTCTLHDCKPDKGCVQSPVPGECTDGDVCSAGDACKAGQCVAGPAKKCDDKDVCTDDSCDAKKGCVYKLNTAPCEDGNKCTTKDACALGSCKPGVKIVCADNNTCTNDACDGTKGCVFKVKPKVVVPACDGRISGTACFRALSGARTFVQAESACVAWGGHLTSIHNATENNVVLSEAMARCGTGWAWIGLTDVAKEGAYAWTDGSSVNYTKWSKGEPNNAGGAEDRVHMMDGGSWNDHTNTVKLQCAVCRRGLPVACDDSNACTSAEVCTAGGKCTPAIKDCNDHNACTVDKCDKAKGCSHTAVKDGSKCGAGVCSKGTCVIGSSKYPAKSCQEIADVATLQPKNGVYWLDPDGGGKIPKFRTFCAFNPGVGWTLAMKLSGASKTFRYDSGYWTNSSGYNTNSVNFDTSQAKLAPFWTMPFKQVLLSMKLGTGYTWMVVPKTASSLRTVFASNKFQATKLGRNAWLGLLGNSSLQPRCNREGFNVGDRGAQVRIGIIGNNENSCSSPDSRLGFGGRGYRCGQDDNNTVGNTARCGGHKGNRNTKVFGYVFIR